MGQVLQAGAGQAPARQALLRAGLADTTPATTINRVCGSGLKSIMFAAAGIRAGDGDVYVAGGMESMNQAPFLLRKARFGYRLGNGTLEDSTVLDGLWCSDRGLPHGHPRRAGGDQDQVSREDQDAFALACHRSAVAAIDAGRFDAEMAPVTVRDAKGRETVVAVDESPRRDTTAEALARLAPAFDLPEGEDRGSATIGTVTAGNAPGITDGAAAMVVASERAVERRAHAARPDRRLRPGRGRAQVAVPRPGPGRPGPGGADGLPIEAYDLVEINEAFAAQVLADGRELGFDWAKVNVNGGAIALGHPIGASGARIVVTLLHELSAAAAATAWRRCASAAAARSRWRSSASRGSAAASPANVSARSPGAERHRARSRSRSVFHARPGRRPATDLRTAAPGQWVRDEPPRGGALTDLPAGPLIGPTACRVETSQDDRWVQI